MWSPLSKILEAIALIRLPRPRWRRRLVVGDARSPDYLGTARWKDVLHARRLAQIWGPRPDGPWWPFHCLTLFASLDYLRKGDIGPLARDPLADRRYPAGKGAGGGMPDMPDWLDSTTVLFVDLAGPESVQVGAALAANGCDLVCTFNNWPHPKGVLASQSVLAALLRYASYVADHRRHPDTPAPVAWLCDHDRFGGRAGRPGEFDNRYFIEDSLLPGPKYLRERGIGRIVYLGLTGQPVKTDLEAHLFAYQRDGFELHAATLGPDGIGRLRSINLRGNPFRSAGFMMAAGGGFGATVPSPSSGGG